MLYFASMSAIEWKKLLLEYILINIYAVIII